jgi:hypothetical protein
MEGERVIPVPSSVLDTEKRLEDALENDIGILGLDRLLLIGRQVPTRFGKFIDLLALGPNGDLHVIELKRDKTPREVVAQALDYGSWVRDLSYDAIAALFDGYTQGSDFDAAQQEAFGAVPEELNGTHHLIIVASELDLSTERILDYLGQFDVPINVVFFRHFNDGVNEYLGRCWLVDPAQAETRVAQQSGRKRKPWNGRDFYVSFGEGATRNWDDAVTYGFVCGGGGKWYSQSLSALQPGHLVFVHIPQRGYVGVGRVTESVQPAASFTIKTPSGRSLLVSASDLKAPNVGHDLDDLEQCEHFVRVEWLQTHDREHAYWESGFFANQNTAAKFRDTSTLRRLQEHFGVEAVEA